MTRNEKRQPEPDAELLAITQRMAERMVDYIYAPFDERKRIAKQGDDT